MHIKIVLTNFELNKRKKMEQGAINNNSKDSTSIKIKLKGEALQRVLDRQAEALRKGHRISMEVAIEKLILGK